MLNQKAQSIENNDFNKAKQHTIKTNIETYNENCNASKSQYNNLELAKQRAARIKRNVVNDLESYLKEFEFNFQKNGGNLLWAVDNNEAIALILDIIKKNNIKKVVQSKSIVNEEIELNKHLNAFGVDATETNFGDFITKTANEKSSNFTIPTINKTKEDISKIYHNKFNTPENISPKEIAEFTRTNLRKKFIDAQMGITGADFLVADIGAIALSENDGSGILSMSTPKIHVAVVGIEKIIPSIKDLDLFLSLLATYRTGQKTSTYNSIISGPKKSTEIDGPEKMYVILLDNGRSDLLATSEKKLALSCISCGACFNNCPVYKSQEKTFNTTFQNPISSVITPYNLPSIDDYIDLSFASTLCGKCSEVCPVKIPIHELLIYNRKEIVENGDDNSLKFIMKMYKRSMSKRWIVETIPTVVKNIGMKAFISKSWGNNREIPKFTTSFSHQWKQKHKK